jgi:predicted nucleic acid-binding protein
MIASTSSSRALVDTNIVVYSYDLDDPQKHDIARDLLEKLSSEGRLVFSTQVLNEFCSVMMKPRRKTPLTPEQISDRLRNLSATGEIVRIAPSMTFRALDAMPRHGLSFWDALIWSTAAENGVATIYTEDFQDGRDIEGVRFINPFLPGTLPAP